MAHVGNTKQYREDIIHQQTLVLHTTEVEQHLHPFLTKVIE